MIERAFAAVLIAIALVTGGYRWGAHATDNAWQAKDAKRVAADVAAATAASIRADKASGALQAELLQQSITNDELTKAFYDYKRRHPILARRNVIATTPAPAAGVQAPSAVCDSGAAGADPGITLGAVWMWNSALAGRDTPEGACGLADQSEGACAADAGVSLEEAWDNQALNAKLCAQDRLRHQRLIDFLKGNNK